MSPGFASFFSSWTMNVDVLRSVLPYSPCRTCHSTATTMLFCILLLTTTPVFSDLTLIICCRVGLVSRVGRVGVDLPGLPGLPALPDPLLSQHGLHAREIAAHRANPVG